MITGSEERGFFGVRVESFLPAGRDLLQAMLRQLEKPRLLVFWRTHNSNGLWQHHLVGAVRVQVNAGEEGCLRGVSLKRKAA